MRTRTLTAVLALLLSVAVFGQPQRTGPQQPARDTPAQSQESQSAPQPTARITGRVVATDSGRPVQRARVQVRAPELPGGRAVLTDESGAFDFTELPAGRYTVTVSKTGYISLEYGQRRPLQPGIPLEVGDGQQLRNVDFSLPKGGVIAGRLVDEVGDPVVGASVRIMRYRYLQGDKQLVPAGAAETDDRGQYRVWGLDPGDYYVNAATRPLLPNFGGPRGPGGRGPGFGAGADAAGGQNDENYAPTYYPGVASPNDALPVTLGVSEERDDVNFALLLVHTADLSGHVMNPGGVATTSGFINLQPEGTGGGGRRGGRGGFGQGYGSRINWDGAFAIRNVPPGRYILNASSDDTGVQAYATQPITVSGVDVPDMMVLLQPGATISGTIKFDAASPSSGPTARNVRITAVAADSSEPAARLNAKIDQNGNFQMDGVPAGPHFIRDADGLRGWALEQVLVDGHDVTDTPLDVRSGQNLTGVTVLFTNRLTEVTGVVTNQSGQPVTDFTVLAFPTDSTLWRPQSRQIMTARPDQTGEYQIEGLPPGDYYLTTVDPTEPGEWFEPDFLRAHISSAAHLTLNQGDAAVRDFQITIK
jgi:Carboxypeptidase regulatory-like domain